MKRFWRTRTGTALVCLAVSLLLACGLEWVQLGTQPKEYQSVQKTEGGNLELLQEPVRIDGQGEIDLALDAGGAEAETLAVVLAESAAADITVKAVFTGENVPKASQRLIIPMGMDRLTAEIPSGGYGNVKLKITGSGTVQSAALQGNVSYVREEVKEEFRVLRAALMAGILFVLFMALYLLHGWTRVKECFTRGWKNVSGDWKNTLIHLAVFGIAFGAVYTALRFYMPYVLGKPYNWMMRTLALSAALSAGCLFCFRKTLAKKAEVFFLIFCLLIGGNIAVLNPAYPGNSWDEAIHYRNANAYSYLGESRLTEADSQGIYDPDRFVYELEGLDAYYADLEALNQEAALVEGGASVNHAWMGSYGFGLFAGRALGIGYQGTFVLGRLCGVLAYAIIGFFAIRRLRSGKMILAAVLLLPEALFLAGSYSYDPGVTVWIALGMSYYFAEWQERQKKLKWGNALVMIAALILGCMAKTVYFPVLLLILFQPRDKFRDKGGADGTVRPVSRWMFNSLVAAAIAGLILSFVVPFLTSNGAGDDRGGSGVNAFGQAMFILQHPMEYTGILLRFMRDYLNPDGAQFLLTNFAYRGAAPNWVIYVILLAVAAVSDKSNCDDHLAERGWIRAAELVILLGTICLAATSMFVAFTEAGSQTIAGCQPRYLIPLIYPAMMLMGFKGVHNESNRAAFNGVLFGAIGFVGFSAVLMQVVNLYY